MNEHWLAILQEQVHGDDPLAPLWIQADTRVLHRVARCPILLIDLYFQRPDWWQRIAQKRGTSAPAEAAPAADRTSRLLRETLMEAWALGRTMPRALNLAFGMAYEVSATIVQLGAHDIDRIVIEKARHLKARWSENRSFWKGLLNAAIGTDDQALGYVHLHCLQVLGSEALP